MLWLAVILWCLFDYMFLFFLPPAGQNSYVLAPPLSLWKVPSDLSVSVAYSESEVAQSCLLFATLWTVAYQARILEWVAISFSRGSSRPRDWTWVSCTAGRLFTIWATREALSYAAAAAAKSLQSCQTLCDPTDSSPPGSSVPGILQARTLEWVAISFSNAWKWKVKGKSLSRVWLFATPWTAGYQAPPSMGFSRQEYWSGVPLPSPTSIHKPA